MLHTFKYSQHGDSTTSLRSLSQYLEILLVKKCIIIFNLNLPWYNWRPFPLILLFFIWENRLTAFQVVVVGPPSVSLSPDETPPTPSVMRLVFQTLPQHHCPSLDSLQHLNILLVSEGPKLGSLSSAKHRGTATALAVLARMTLVFLAPGHSWLMSSCC